MGGHHGDDRTAGYHDCRGRARPVAVDDPLTPAPTSSPPTRNRGRDIARRVILTLLIVGSLVGLFFTGKAAVTGGNEASNALPEVVDRVIPPSGASVPRQSQVGIDVTDGHDAYLQINGVEVRTAEEGLVKDLGTGLVQFQPGPGRPVEELNPGQNCVVAFVFSQIDGPDTAQPVSWCFEAI